MRLSVTYLSVQFLGTFTTFSSFSFYLGEAMFRNHTLEETHVAGWAEVWDSGRMDLEGNVTLASSVYSALYYILSAMQTVEETTWPFIGLSPEDLGHGNIPDIVSLYNF